MEAEITTSETRNPFAAGAFTKWWIASVAGGIGVGIQAVTVPLFIRDREDLELRSAAIAAALIAQTLPAALLTLLGGVVADRVERRDILIRSYSVAAVASCAYLVLSVLDVRTVWAVFPVAAVVGIATAFTNPARQSMLPLLVTTAQHQNGVIFGTMGVMATTQFIGPMIGGVVADLFGLTTAFAAEVITLAAAAAIFWQIRTARQNPTGRNVIGDLLDGVHYVLAHPHLWGLLLVPALTGIFIIGPFGVTVALIVPDVLKASTKWIGLLWGCFGGGVFFGSLLLVWWPLPRRGLAVCLATIACGVLLALYGLSENLGLSAVLLALSGCAAAVHVSYVVALLQQNAEPKKMGRVMSMYGLAFLASMPIGYAQAGLLSNLAGSQATLVLGGSMATAGGLLILFGLKAVRDLP